MNTTGQEQSTPEIAAVSPPGRDNYINSDKMDVFANGSPRTVLKMLSVDSNLCLEEKIRLAYSMEHDLSRILYSNLGLLSQKRRQKEDTFFQKFTKKSANIKECVDTLSMITEQYSFNDAMLSQRRRCPRYLFREHKVVSTIVAPICILRIDQHTLLNFGKDNVIRALLRWTDNRKYIQLHRKSKKMRMEKMNQQMIPVERISCLDRRNEAITRTKETKNVKRKAVKERCCTTCRKKQKIEIPIKGHFCPYKTGK